MNKGLKRKFIIITTVPISLNFFSGQIQILKKEFDVEVISSKGVIFDRFCEKEDISGTNIEMNREISLLSDLQSLYRLFNKFYKDKPNIIHGNTPKASLLSMLAGFMARVPIRVYYVHGLRYEGEVGLKKIILKSMESVSCLLATDIFSVSHGVREKLHEDNITKKNINLIKNGSVNGLNGNYFSPVNPEISNFKSIYNIEDNHFIFGFVGRVVKDKGIKELVLSFIEINKKYNHTKLLLVGNYEDKLDPLDQAIKNEIETNENIIFTGFQSDIRPYLKMMNVFVSPSYREGFGISLMEAGAMNLPVITTDIIGCNEVIKDDYNGILIPSKSIPSLIVAMEQYIIDKNFYNKVVSRTRKFMLEKFEQNALWKETLKFYIELK